MSQTRSREGECQPRAFNDLRELSAPSVMGAFTGFRASVAWFQTWAVAAPTLAELGLAFWNPNTDPDEVASEYRDVFIESYEDAVGAALTEVDKGTDHTRAYLR